MLSRQIGSTLVRLFPFFFCAIAHAGARFFSGRVVPPGRNEYLQQPALRTTWSPEEAVRDCERDLECAGFSMRGPVKSPEKRHVAFFR